jgi:hypothetical protein
VYPWKAIEQAAEISFDRDEAFLLEGIFNFLEWGVPLWVVPLRSSFQLPTVLGLRKHTELWMRSGASRGS